MGFQSSINQMLNIAAATQTVGSIKEPLTENARYLKEKFDLSDKEALQEAQKFDSSIQKMESDYQKLDKIYRKAEAKKFDALYRKMEPEYQKMAEIFRRMEANKSVAQERASRNIKNRPQKGVPTLNINDLRIVGGKK